MAQDLDPEARKPTSWWQTLPGVVTALTGLLTAVGGLLLALNQVGMLGHGHSPASTPPAAAAQTAETAPPAAQSTPTPSAAIPSAIPQPATPSPAARTVAFPAGAKVTLGNNRGRGTYELLAARLDPRSAEVGTLTLQIRLTNAGPADIGFWNDSFRLVIDGVPRAPTSWLNSSVDPRSAKEAELVFSVPLSAKTLKLAINSGDEDGEIPLTLK
jgi:hypothetical protein